MYDQIDSNKRSSIILIVVFFLLLGAMGYFMGVYSGGGQYPYVGVVVAILFSLVFTSFSYFGGDKVALISSGAKKVEKTDNPYLYRMVENLCITAGMPVPKVHIIPDPAINAFATGRNPELASIAITTGAIEKLKNEELEGVIAHELSHIKNYDIRFMMLVAVLVGSIAIMSDVFIRMSFFGRGRKSDSKNSGGSVMLIVGLVFIILSPIVARLIKLMISRRREYLADASGSLLTRYPEGLARALEKIAQQSQPMEKASTATAHLFIANPFKSKGIKGWFSTHPPVEDRIKKLRGMA